MECILKCRTPALGGQVYRCECGTQQFAYHSCNHRACPQCGQADAEEWLSKQQVKLLPVPYFLVTFTVPEEMRFLIGSHQKTFYNLLFSESSGTLQDVASNPKYLGGQLGFLGVLHTWSRQLVFHPHIHYVVPGAGLSKDGRRWHRLPNPDFFLPQPVLSRRWRNRFRAKLKKQHPELFALLPSKTWKKEWVVQVQPVGSGQAALKYLSAYVYKTALGSNRILKDDGYRITFSFRDSEDRQEKSLCLEAREFLRRFLQHVLPSGFQRVRYFGWWSAAAKNRWTRILALLDWKQPDLIIAPLTPLLCLKCGKQMLLCGTFSRPPP